MLISILDSWPHLLPALILDFCWLRASALPGIAQNFNVIINPTPPFTSSPFIYGICGTDTIYELLLQLSVPLTKNIYIG